MVSQISDATRASDAKASHIIVAARRVADDEEIIQATLRNLRALGYDGLQSITCEHHEGMLVLRGCVPSYFMKQLAQTVASKISGVKIVVNSVSVETSK